MTTLHLGVVDLAYSDADAKGASTTGEVAEILESEYHVMRVFLEQNEEKIGDWLAQGMIGELESISQGRPTTLYSRQLGTRLGGRSISGLSINGKIEERFRDFLALGEWGQISKQGVAAAEAGVSHRKKHPYAKKNKARPAFIDTGLYQASFRAWVD